MDVTVRRLVVSDRTSWLALRTTLYVEEAGDEPIALDDEIDMMLASDGWAAFGAEAPDGTLIGFILTGAGRALRASWSPRGWNGDGRAAGRRWPPTCNCRI